MKKFATIAAIVLTTALPSLAGARSIEGESTKAMKDFNATHMGAPAIWNKGKCYNEVLYFWNGKMMDAYYDLDGNLIGTFHDIAPESLPQDTRKKIASWYKGYKIMSATIMQKEGEDDVTYIKVQSARHLRILEVTADGDVEEFQTLR